MASTKSELIAQLTANNRSRHGYFPILRQALVEDTLWLLLDQPNGIPVLAWELLTQTEGAWTAELYSSPDGHLATFASAEAAFAAAEAGTPTLMTWKAYVERVLRKREQLRKFRRDLAPNDTLRVNGYAYTLVRRLLDRTGWIVKRDGTEMVLKGATFDTAVSRACTA